MAGTRDLVRFLPNERVDIPDFEAVQRNTRSDYRSQWYGLLWGGLTTASFLVKVFEGFEVTEDSGGASALIEIAGGTAAGGEELPDGDVEFGVIFGREVQTSQTLDFTGQPNNTYTIYVRYAMTPGVAATRVFWNATDEEEDVDVIETRNVVDWDAVYATSSPGDEWVPIAEVVWGGSTISNSNITDTRQLFFEGKVSTSYVHTWGTSDDRQADRAEYGVTSLWRWVHAVRRQLEEIFDSALGTKWYAEPPYSLQEGRDHEDTASDPHGATLTQTTIEVGTFIDIEQSLLLDSAGGDPPVVRAIVTSSDLWGGHDPDASYNSGVMVLDNDYPTASSKWALTGGGLASAVTASAIARVDVEGSDSSNGGEIVGLLCHFYYTTAASDMGCDVILQEVDLTDGTVTDLATLALTLNSTGGLTQTSGTLSLATDTDNKYYRIAVVMDENASAGANLGIYAVEVLYRKTHFFNW